MKRQSGSEPEMDSKSKQKIWVLGIDVERLGQNPQIHSTIQIGAAVVNETKKILATYRHSEYRSEKEYQSEFITEDLCMSTFWSKHPEELKRIENDTDRRLNIEQSRINMIAGFCHFMSEWEQKAEEAGAMFVLTMDNKICDAWTINALITTYMPNTHPVLPYSFYHTNKYLKVYETLSLMWGMIMAKDPSMHPYDGVKRSCEEIFCKTFNITTDGDGDGSIPKHTHMADEDAIECAWYLQTCLNLTEPSSESSVPPTFL
jgi:hypothetical protein